MSTIIEIRGRLDEEMVRYVKNSLKIAPIPDDKEIVIDINSEGGDVGSMEKIKTFLYFMSKYKGYKIIGRLTYGESAALLLFLNCEERQVIVGESIGVIHLPVIKPYQNASIADISNERLRQVSFIMRRAEKIQEHEIYELENKKLDAELLMELGIANKIVEIFTLT